MAEQRSAARTGFVAIIGRPNVGKSTLLNALVGEHVSITSRKPQTTRHRLQGVLTRGAAPTTQQFVFVDTPGFQQRHRSLLTRRMNEAVRGVLNDVDAIVVVVDARGLTPEDNTVISLLPPAAPNVILALNKTDLLKQRDALLPLIEKAAARYPFAAIVPVSAEKRRQLDELLDETARLLPEGEPLFEADQYTDRSVRFLAAEAVREKAFRLLGDELPYGIAVAVEHWDEQDDRADIAVALIVERESHMGIVIGAGGAKLREIGRLARADIAALLDKPVHLQTHVRVRRGWSDDARELSRLGYE